MDTALLLDRLFEVMTEATEKGILKWDGYEDVAHTNIRLDTKFTFKRDGGGTVVCLDDQPHYTDASKKLAKVAQSSHLELLRTRKDAAMADVDAKADKAKEEIRKKYRA